MSALDYFHKTPPFINLCGNRSRQAVTTAPISQSGWRSYTELPQMVVEVPVGYPGPGGLGHRAEERVSGPVPLCRKLGKPAHQGLEPRQILFPPSGLCYEGGGWRADSSLRPGNPVHGELLDDRVPEEAAARLQPGVARGMPQLVRQVSQHSGRVQPPPPGQCIGLQRPQPGEEGRPVSGTEKGTHRSVAAAGRT